ncbi:phosphatidylinositol-3-phosphatase SAC1 isoform X2 [Physcomitrium patens]|uniref:SAC domain-containing protein n=1 Tax=Physcomitrium patens TaxID=3218 RepID=A0A7I4FI69_PHYPA|nr:phosphoinositide phosphatase SAC1-like isoform X2 [Physcomitrium patens]|eukprot:XP_024365419.1 phosphoinositide phosphatase SAC1-like isoform X2 [Physcomitrella patens]
MASSTEVSHSKVELRYKKLLIGVDLTKDFYFSYTYRIMQTMQTNVKSLDDDQMPYDNMFVWNAFLTSGIRQSLGNTRWTVALVHGFFQQEKLSVFGRIFVITLVGRRSRHFAGTRYLKRGLNDKGRVANDVETEQLVMNEETGIGRSTVQISSVVQHRGSIPLFWSQEMSRLSPKPDIVLQRFDPTYHTTKLHFEDLSKRYGDPIIILSLIKTVEKRPREMMLRREFANAVGYLNQTYPEENQLKFIHWDFHKFAKSGSKSANVLAVLGSVAADVLDLTGFYYGGKALLPKRKLQQSFISTTPALPAGRKSPSRDRTSLLDLSMDRRLALDLGNRQLCMDLGSLYTTTVSSMNSRLVSVQEVEKINSKVDKVREPQYQNGVLRTNCIDCLDRTNVAQYAFGLEALGRQLQAVGLTDSSKIDPDSGVAAALMDMYQNMGDSLALQYGGSEAHNYVFPERQGKWKATTQSQEFLKSIRRYYSNTITDGEKQDAMNLFLGHFQPQKGKPALWELETDYYLHAGGREEEAFLEHKKPGKDSKKPSLSFQKPRNSKLFSASPYEEDFHRQKLTSFDKLQATCGSAKSVRMYGDSGFKRSAATGVASDAAEVQLKTPNWLYGQKRSGDNNVAKSDAEISLQAHATKLKENNKELEDMNWLTAQIPRVEEELFTRYISSIGINEDDSWYGTRILPGTVNESEANRHYLECCKGPLQDFEDLTRIKGRESFYPLSELIQLEDEDIVRHAMEAALSEGNNIGSSDLLDNHMSSDSTALDSSCNFFEWLRQDKQLCQVLS